MSQLLTSVTVVLQAPPPESVSSFLPHGNELYYRLDSDRDLFDIEDSVSSYNDDLVRPYETVMVDDEYSHNYLHQNDSSFALLTNFEKEIISDILVDDENKLLDDMADLDLLQDDNVDY